MKKCFIFLCIVIIFIGIVGCPSSDEAPEISQSSFTSTRVTTSDADSLPLKNGAFPFPEPATLVLLGTGLVGLAVVGRKKFKK